MSALQLPGPMWLVGCGNMGGAMLEGWLARGFDPAQVTVMRPSGKSAAPGVRVVASPPEDEVPAIVLLAVKPQKLPEVAPSLASALDPQTIFVSILAGVELATLRQRFPVPRSVFRAMPNLPVRLNRGLIGLYTDRETPEQRASLNTLMSALGSVEWFDDEALIGTVTALGGSSPAFLYRFIEGLARAGEEQGLDSYQARRIALATVAGAAELAATSGEKMSQMADRVASPNGTTRAGLDILDRDGALFTLLSQAMAAAVARSREMAEEARGRVS